MQSIRRQLPVATVVLPNGSSQRVRLEASRAANKLWVKCEITLPVGRTVIDTMVSGTPVRIIGTLNTDQQDCTLDIVQVDCIERRELERVDIEPGSCLINFGPDIIARDLSARGMGIEDPSEQLKMGTTIQGEWPDGTRSEWLVCRRNAARVGLRALGRPRALVEAYAGVRFPDICRRGTVPLEALQTLFGKSGFLGLRGEANGLDWRAWYAVSGDSARNRDSIVVDASGQPVAHLSLTSVSPRLTIAHQLLAIGVTRQAVRARTSLYLDGMSWLCANDDGATYLGANFDPTKAWHAQFFEEFVTSLGRPQYAATYRWDRFAVPTNWRSAVSQPRVGYNVADGTERTALATAAFARWLPALAWKSQFDAPRDEPNNLVTSRAMVVRSRVDGNVVAFAVLSRAVQPLSVFGLFDHIRIVPAEPRNELDPGAVAAVLEAGREYYGPHVVPLLSCPVGTLTRPRAVALRHVEQMGTFVVHRAAMPSFHTFVNFCSARLLNYTPKGRR